MTHDELSGRNAIEFLGTGQSCDDVLKFIHGPDHKVCIWKSCTYDGGFLSAPNGPLEFVPGDWIIRKGDGTFTVLCDRKAAVCNRQIGIVRLLMYGWLGEEISEGKMVQVTGLDRLTLRLLKEELLTLAARAANTPERTPPHAE